MAHEQNVDHELSFLRGLLSTRLSVLSIAAFDSLQAMPSSLTL